MAQSWIKTKSDQWFGKHHCILCGGISATSGKCCNFYSHLSLKTVFSALTLLENCYIMNNSSPIQHIYPAWKRILTIGQIMKARKLHKTQLHYCLLNWEIFGGAVLANIPKPIFAISPMNWGKSSSTARATFKNLNF